MYLDIYLWLNNEEKVLMEKYMFMIDCHGMQSIVPLQYSSISPALLTCHTNEQRRAMMGIIELEECVKDGLSDLIKTDEGRRTALNLIKTAKYEVPSNKKSLWLRWMSQIPNDELDPHYSKNEESDDE